VLSVKRKKLSAVSDQLSAKQNRKTGSSWQRAAIRITARQEAVGSEQEESCQRSAISPEKAAEGRKHKEAKSYQPQINADGRRLGNSKVHVRGVRP